MHETTKPFTQVFLNYSKQSLSTFHIISRFHTCARWIQSNRGRTSSLTENFLENSFLLNSQKNDEYILSQFHAMCLPAHIRPRTPFLLQNLSQLLTHEAKLICGVEDKIRSLHNELEIINAYLKNSEKKKSKNEIEQTVVNQIRDVAHAAEDVIDTFLTNVAMHKRRSKAKRILHGLDHAKLLRDVADKIDKIKTTITEIRDNKMNYELPESSDPSKSAREEEERLQSLQKLRRNVEEKDVVGFVNDSNEVIKRLVEGGLRCNVVSIIGMGGLGKTTLARKVYNSNEVKQYFDCLAWVFVSNECRARELLLALLKQLMPDAVHERRGNNNNKKKKGKKHQETEEPRDFSSLSEEELKIEVFQCLGGKRYLLVLDDLWKNQDWDELQEAFPDDNNGSRILITSRFKEVAFHTSQYPPYDLQFLDKKQSWELFSRKVFRGEECPSDLEPFGRQMVESCRGLPLSIVVLAGLLSNKEKSYNEWSRLARNVKWHLTQDETRVMDIVLKLSYDDLPRELKWCFLYLGIFPEDYEISVMHLVERWVAERFIPETNGRDPYEVAENYLYQLIDRSLVQVARVRTRGGAKTCRIHDFLRDLCISEGEKDKLFEVCTDNNIISTKPRRLSINCGLSRYISKLDHSRKHDHSSVRSLSCFDSSSYMMSSEWKWFSKCLKLVRVLDLVGNCCKKIPSNLGDLFHLSYLRIDSPYIRTIPASICNLENLQTLDLGPTVHIDFISFPDSICKLKKLRRLNTFGPIKLHCHGSKSDGDVMENLQIISAIALNGCLISLIEEKRFPKLRKLRFHVSPDSEDELPKLLLSLQRLSHLDKITIVIQDYYRRKEWKPQELLQGLEHLSQLSGLKIANADPSLPMCLASLPPNLTRLTLVGMSCINGDGMNALRNLTELQMLRLHGGWYHDRFDLECIAGGFRKLQVFQMINLKVKNWELAPGAMPCLQNVLIDNCDEFISLPNELWYLPSLREVHVVNCDPFWPVTMRDGPDQPV